MVLWRERSPRSTLRPETGTLNASANVESASCVARPSSGAAQTSIRRRPAETPRTWHRLARGRTDTSTTESGPRPLTGESRVVSFNESPRLVAR